jgi:single-strand DNA-binding protein
MNKLFTTGRLTRDPEIRTTSTGKKVASFSIAVEKFGKDKSVYFFSVTAWEKLADIIDAYAIKGVKVAIIGELVQETFEHEGNKREKIYILAKEIELLGNKQQPNLDTQNQESDESAEINIDDLNIIKF